MYRKRFDSDCVVLLRVLRPSFLVSILDLACYVESSHFSALLRHLRRGCVVDAMLALAGTYRYSLALAWLWRISGSGWAGKLSDSLVGLSELSVGLGCTGEAIRWLWSYSLSRLWLCYGAIRCFGYGREVFPALAGPGRYSIGIV